jgi:hypothetical protein
MMHILYDEFNQDRGNMRGEQASTDAGSDESVEGFEMQPMHHDHRVDHQAPPAGFVEVDLNREHSEAEELASRVVPAPNRTSIMDAFGVLSGGNNCEVM